MAVYHSGMSEKKYGTAACVLITNDEGLVLTVSRKQDPNKVGIPGGKREEWETYEEAAIRECSEETGVVPRNLRKLFEGPCTNDAANDEFNTVTFVAEADFVGEKTSPEGLLVTWHPWCELVDEKFSPFARYNQQLYDVACPTIDIDESRIKAS